MLTKRGENYYFRLHVPKDIRPVLEKNELVRTLNTGLKSVATVREAAVRANLPYLWNWLRLMKQKLAVSEIKSIVNNWLEKQLEQYSDKLSAPLWLTNNKNIEALDCLLDDLSNREERLSSIICSPNTNPSSSDEEIHAGAVLEGPELSDCQNLAHKLFSENGFPDIDEDSLLVMVRHIADAKIKEIFRQKEIARSFFDKTCCEDKNEYASAKEIFAPSIPLLSEVIKKYFEDQEREQCASATSLDNYKGICSRFTWILGDKPISSYTKDDMRSFVDITRKLPKNYKKNPIFQEKSIEELLEDNSLEKLSISTINNHIRLLKAVFKWAENEDLICSNPTNVIKSITESTKTKIKPRVRFTNEDLKVMTDNLHKEAESGKLNRPERFWVPLIAIFSGMRLNEICQLRICDVQLDSDSKIWFFNVTEVEGETKVKTGAGIRKVPIHPTLIKLGFLDYFNRIKSYGETQLWPKLKKTKKGHLRAIGYWFNGDKKRPGFNRRYVTTDPAKTFHSTRHSVRDEFKQLGINKDVAAEIVGHEYEEGEAGTYTDDFAIMTKLNALSKLNYGLELSHLKPLAELYI